MADAPSDDELRACLPASLQAGAQFTRTAAGLSGAGVYRVVAGDHHFILKTATARDAIAAWRQRLPVLRAAATAGVAPRIVHVDEARCAVVSELVVDRGFGASFMAPASRAASIARLGATIRKVHDLDVPRLAMTKPTQHWLAMLRTSLTGLALPAFADDAIRTAIELPPPASDRAPVLTHHDLNPTNVIDDGERLVFVDWDSAGMNDPLYDLATVAMFLRLTTDEARALVAAHDGAPCDALPSRFDTLRRLVAALCGAMFLHLARSTGYAGRADEAAPELADVYRRMRTGELSVADARGKWTFGLALLAESTGPAR